MKKDLDYYLSLPYTIEITPIVKEHGGGFMATLPQIGRYAIVGDGETIDEALINLDISKRERFAEYIAARVEIPEPGVEIYKGFRVKKKIKDYEKGKGR